jgi:LmbE family N-acetylglucosaminyl deacetylase
VVKFDAREVGTLARDWTTFLETLPIPTLDLSWITDLVVVAAHPDDETLGAGGLIAEAGRRGISVTVVVVTDGSRSNPESSVSAVELAKTRSRELRDAVADLCTEARVVELGFPDGNTNDNRDQIAAALADLLSPGATIAAPWRGDGHRDHRVVGELSAALAKSAKSLLLEYPIWMWHWARPDDPAVPWDMTRSLELPPAIAVSKGRALTLYRSQTEGPGVGIGDIPVLSPEFIEHFERGTEYFIVTSAEQQVSKAESYFDGLYAHSLDPWRLATRWYEDRKRQISLASLPRPRYSRALEVGCSVGELTALIATRADAVLAIDISEAAVALAAERTSGIANVSVRHQDATIDFPAGKFDLIVLSEVGYYWDVATLRETVAQIAKHLADDGTVLACHWRHPVADYPLSGDAVHRVLNQEPALHAIALHREADFVLEVFGTAAESVAQREGLA